jgi:hypothetical protein
MAWLMAGPGITFAQAYSLAPHNAFYLVVFCGIPVAAGLLGGFVAAKLSHGNPYLSALVSALLVMASPRNGWNRVTLARLRRRSGNRV